LHMHILVGSFVDKKLNVSDIAIGHDKWLVSIYKFLSLQKSVTAIAACSVSPNPLQIQKLLYLGFFLKFCPLLFF
jgi:hypothetical protein